MRIEPRSNHAINRDERIDKADRDYEEFRREAYDKLDPAEKIAVNKSAVVLRDMLKQRSHSAELSLDSAIEVVMTALYFKKFGETPRQTRVR